MVTEVIRVEYKGQEVGAVSYDAETRVGHFEYEPRFRRTGIELSPIHMPLSDRIYTFPGLDRETFKGLPGLLADSLPDDFGHAVLNAWVAKQGGVPADITPLQRLQYTGARGMGALEFRPAESIRGFKASQEVDIEALVGIAQEILDSRAAFAVDLQGNGAEDRDAMQALLSVGTSAGGARPKAVLAFNESFTSARSGQTDAPEGYTHYLLKFDGVEEHRKESQTFGDPKGFGALEYVYYLMARQCGISMMPCHLLPEGHRRHFITQRFDRRGNAKVHVQTLCAMAHASFKQVGRYSYEEVLQTMRQMRLPVADAMELLRRVVFNVIARNHDDHTKNFSFMMDPESNAWSLAPAYDVAYSYKPGSHWVDQHAMSLNGKRDNFTRADLLSLVNTSSSTALKRGMRDAIDRTLEVVSNFTALAKEHEVPDSIIDMVTPNLRLKL